jgi:hypothetical protein
VAGSESRRHKSEESTGVAELSPWVGKWDVLSQFWTFCWWSKPLDASITSREDHSFLSYHGFNAHVLCHRGSILKKAHQSPLGLENLGSMFDTVQSLHLCHRQASDLKELTNLMIDMVLFYVCGVLALNVRWKQILTSFDTYCSGGYVFHSHVTNLIFVCCGFPWYM